MPNLANQNICMRAGRDSRRAEKTIKRTTLCQQAEAEGIRQKAENRGHKRQKRSKD